MAQHYRSVISEIAKQFDNSNLPNQIYDDLAWAGLRVLENNVNSIAFDNLSPEEKQRITSNLSDIFFNGISNCE